MEQHIEGICKEICVFKITKHRKVDYDAQSHQNIAFGLLIAFVDAFANEKIHERAKNENANEKSTGFVIKEKRN